jgi:triacylglycerol lipase
MPSRFSAGSPSSHPWLSSRRRHPVFRKNWHCPGAAVANWPQKIWRTIWGLIALVRTGKFQNIADHSMTIYVGKLDAWAKVNLKQTQDRREVTADPAIASKA